jgi:predicted nucleic acid-binding protein
MVWLGAIEQVVDCSVALKWKLRQEPYHAEAVALLLDIRAGIVEPIAPVIFVAEVGSALLRAARRGRLTFDEARQAIDDILGVNVSLVEVTPALAQRAFEIAWAHQQGFFDCLYVAVAEVRGGRSFGRVTSGCFMPLRQPSLSSVGLAIIGQGVHKGALQRRVSRRCSEPSLSRWCLSLLWASWRLAFGKRGEP